MHAPRPQGDYLARAVLFFCLAAHATRPCLFAFGRTRFLPFSPRATRSIHISHMASLLASRFGRVENLSLAHRAVVFVQRIYYFKSSRTQSSTCSTSPRATKHARRAAAAPPKKKKKKSSRTPLGRREWEAQQGGTGPLVFGGAPPPPQPGLRGRGSGGNAPT
jgi:hypothetical protein